MPVWAPRSTSASAAAGDLDRDLHGEMVRRGPDPSSLQRNRLLRLVHNRDAHQVLIPDHAARGIEVDPAGAGDVDLDPGMGVAPRDAVVVVVIVKMQISGNEPRGDSKRAQRRDHERRKVATAPAGELQGPDRVLNSLLMSRHMLEGPVDGLRHIDEKLIGVGRSVLAQERGGPAIEPGVLGQRREEAREIGPIFLDVSERMASSKVFNIGFSEVGRRVAETHGAFEAKLRGAFRETGGRDMIAEDIPRPADMARRGRYFEFGFEHNLVIIVARTRCSPKATGFL